MGRRPRSEIGLYGNVSEKCYFESYARTSIHRDMIKDRVRTQTYRDAIYHNKHLFKDKIVLDVGCGTGILSLFAARAGAKKVIGVEFSDFAIAAKKVVRDNNMMDVVTIVHGKVEDIVMPDDVEHVDVILSEWMGYCLFYESMLDSVLFARDKWLAKDGIMFPDQVSLHLCGIADGRDYTKTLTQNSYDLDLQSMNSLVLEEPDVRTIRPGQVITETVTVKEFDLQKDKIKDIEFRANFKLTASKSERLTAITSYFDVTFSKCHKIYMFSTSPFHFQTHWRQTTFYLKKDFPVTNGDVVIGSFQMIKNKKNFRDFDFTIVVRHQDEDENEDSVKNDYTMHF